jgi:hypothetical protein
MTSNAIKPCKRCRSQPVMLFQMGTWWDFKNRPYHPEVSCERCKQTYCSCVADTAQDAPIRYLTHLTALQVIGRWNCINRVRHHK